MELARVIGSVTATMKDGGLAGLKLALVERVDATGTAVAPVEVAADGHGAGVGELVLVVRGSAARQPAGTRGLPTDLAIVAIIDTVDTADSIAAAREARTSDPEPRPKPVKRATRSKQ